jgi:hypothetical protein
MPVSLRAARSRSVSGRDLGVEDYVKAGAAVVAALYGLGVAVSVLYLNGYGVAHVSFAKPQYILTGFWLVAPLLCGATTVFLAADMLRLAKSGVLDGTPRWLPQSVRRANTYVSTIGGSILLGATPFIFLTVMIGHSINAPHFDPDEAACVTVPAGLLAVLGLALLRLTREGARAIRVSSKTVFTPGLGSVLASIALLLTLIICYVMAFTNFVFPGIPAAVGGGQPRRVTLLLKSPMTFAALGVNQSAQPAKALWLLAETDASYVFIVDSRERQTVTISREAVLAVVTEQ